MRTAATRSIMILGEFIMKYMSCKAEILTVHSELQVKKIFNKKSKFSKKIKIFKKKSKFSKSSKVIAEKVIFLRVGESFLQISR